MDELADIDNMISAYVEAVDEYEREMRRAKIARSAQRRMASAANAEVAYRQSQDLKMLLRGLGVTLDRKF